VALERYLKLESLKDGSCVTVTVTVLISTALLSVNYSDIISSSENNSKLDEFKMVG
jgi:hypothetical protein